MKKTHSTVRRPLIFCGAALVAFATAISLAGESSAGYSHFGSNIVLRANAFIRNNNPNSDTESGETSMPDVAKLKLDFQLCAKRMCYLI